ncbi:hypothetical protein LSAT2_021480 [Lamellibrachia satsuma]|nr:hypothetical protein LSAT2_021480 [Lamellibrachia satsuma]
MVSMKENAVVSTLLGLAVGLAALLAAAVAVFQMKWKLDKENNQYSQVEQSVEAVSKPGLANTRLADLMST